MREMKRGQIWIFFLLYAVIAFLTSCSSFPKNGLPQVEKGKKDSWLFAITSDSGSLKENEADHTYTVTLKGVGSAIVKFTDLPARKVDTIKTETFAKDWNKIFDKGAPNAAIVAIMETPSGNIEEAAVCTILNVSYDSKNEICTFTVKELPNNKAFLIDKQGKKIDKLPNECGPLVMFIDSAEVKSPLKVVIINESGLPDEKVFITLGYDPKKTYNGDLKAWESKSVQELGNSGCSFNINDITSGRIYVSFNNIIPPPADRWVVDPANSALSTTRYDFVELTYNGSDYSCANLSAVDQFGIPMILKADSKPNDTRGFKDSANKIIPKLAALSNCDPQVYIRKGNDFIRILSPVKKPDNYSFFEGYIEGLNGLKLAINDYYYGSPQGPVNYSGIMRKNSITFTDNNNNQVCLDENSFGKPHLYDCNGTFTANNVEENFNNNDSFCVVYRDFLAGANLGLWGAENDSSSWGGTPLFSKGGNEYAKILYQSSNSYGFSFSDIDRKRLKSLLMLNPNGDTLTITIIDDEATGGYTPGTSPSDDPPQPITSGTTFVNMIFYGEKTYAGKTITFNGKEYTFSSDNIPSILVRETPANEGTNRYGYTSFKDLKKEVHVLSVIIRNDNPTGASWEKNYADVPNINGKDIHCGGL